MSHRASLLGRGYSDRHLDSPRLRFRRALALCAMTIFVPGSAQIALGKKAVGWVAVTLWATLLVTLGALYWRFREDRAQVLTWFTDPDVLLFTRVGMAVLALAWVGLLLDAYRLGAPFKLTFVRASVIAVVNLAIIGSVAGSAAFAAQFIQVQRSVVKTVFKETKTSAPLKGRYNILLIGSDARADRTGLRPDTIVVASIDADTGKIVLISLPRNLQNVQFSEDSPMRQVYPYGYNCGPQCLLNAVHTEASNRTDLYPDAKDPGLEATIDAVEGVTNLKINYHVMVNLNGFKGLVDALGGVEIDVKERLAMFGQADAYKQTFIEPGLQRLDGQQALWYARSRVQSDDYTRMGRQKCLMAAMANQLDPARVVTKISQIGKASKELFESSIPRQELGQFADLALKSRGSKIRTVSIVPPKFNTVNPDYPAIHAAIQTAIDRSEGVATPSPTVSKDTSGRSANNADDLNAAC